MEDFYDFAAGYSNRTMKLNKFDKKENIEYKIPIETDVALSDIYGITDYQIDFIKLLLEDEYKRGFMDGINTALEIIDPQEE